MNDTTAWWLYMLRTAQGTLYTGVTTDVERRLNEHASGKRGAKALRGKGPLELAFSQKIGDRAAAQAAEYAVKQLSRANKERLIESGKLPEGVSCSSAP